jgi:hypothetical protein
MIVSPLVAARYQAIVSRQFSASREVVTCGAAMTVMCGRGDLNPHGVATNRT